MNINSLKYKSNLLTEQVKGDADILFISHAKFDNLFPDKQFRIPGFVALFRKGHNSCGGCIMMFIRKRRTLLAPIIKTRTSWRSYRSFIQGLNLRNKKRLISYSLNPNKNSLSNHLPVKQKKLDFMLWHIYNTYTKF